MINVGGKNVNKQVSEIQADVTQRAINIMSAPYKAKGDGVTDDTAAFLSAFNYASTNKLKIFIPKGTYLIKQNITIAMDTIPEIYGDNQGKSILLFDSITGYAITVNTYYTKPFRLRNLTIQQNNQAQTFNGITVVYPSGTQWGGCVLMDNVNVNGFTGIVLNMVNAYGCRFNDSTFQGGQQSGVNVSKILKIEKTSGQFSNMNLFENCTFAWGNIGVQNLGGIRYSFIGCIFTGLNLFLHSPLVPGVDTSRNDYICCWFEEITKGILNADINESTLTPNTPVTNQSALTNMNFSNNNAVNFPAYTLDSTIEPINHQYSQFFLFNGFRVNITNLPLTVQSITPSGWTGTVYYLKNQLGMVTVYGSIKPNGALADLATVLNLPSGYKPLANVVVPISDSPNGGYSGMGFYIATNGNMVVPTGMGSKFSSAFTYNFQVTYTYGS